jgi:uncharacterized BrkB/YihY/UPF0761 family membrane protein
MQTFFYWIIVALSILLCYVAPFWYVLKRGNFKKGVFFTWQLLVLWGVVCLIALLFLTANENTRQFAIETFPDIPECGSYILFGWLWGTIISGLAMGVRWLYKKSNPEIS